MSATSDLTRTSDGPSCRTAAASARFRGHAGRFQYETTELVTFEWPAITFEHLAGPFARCREMSHSSRPTADPWMTHTGTFALRGALWAWPLARAAVKPAFERHVHEHLIALREEVGSEATAAS